MTLNKNIKIFLNYFLGPLLFLWLSASIYNQVKHQPDLKSSWIKIRESVGNSALWSLTAVVLLMIANWSVEALKWKMAVRHIQRLGFFTSFRAVLSGLSFSMNTPNRIGEYVGRVLYMNEGNRLAAVSLTVVSSMSQLIITLFAGAVGLLFLRKRIESAEGMTTFESSLWLQVLQYGVILALLILTLFYFRLSLLARLVEKLRNSRRYAWLVHSLTQLDATLLLRLLSFSAIRYIIFVAQYYLLFRLFQVDIRWWECLQSVTVVFLVLAIIPTFAIAELGIRGKVSMNLFGLFSANSLGISITTATIWLVNLVMPAIAGSLLIAGIKIFRNKNERI